MVSWFRKMIDRIDAVADRPADPSALTVGRTRRGARAVPVPEISRVTPDAEQPDESPGRDGGPPRQELEGREAIERILAEQRGRMRGRGWGRDQPGA